MGHVKREEHLKKGDWNAITVKDTIVKPSKRFGLEERKSNAKLLQQMKFSST